MAAKKRAGFVEPMLLLETSTLLEDAQCLYELKLDGFRTIAFKTGGKVHLRSRIDKDFSLLSSRRESPRIDARRDGDRRRDRGSRLMVSRWKCAVGVS
jgi:hypothetical protein